MVKSLASLTLAAALAVAANAAFAASNGAPAPVFTIGDTAGKPVKLADYRGRYVVLEWTNPECPFVRAHYSSGNMQALQKRFTGDGVVWLTINSTASAHSEYLRPDQQAAWLKQQGAAPTTALLDADGTVGRAYGAKTTPHMYIIDPGGKLQYAGAIDDKRSSNPADVTTANNYIVRAFDELRAGKAVSAAATSPYGCSIKYQ